MNSKVVLHPTIALLQSSSLTRVVQQEIERLILAGELRPGDKLNELDLAERLGVSRGPVREAFRMLEEAGLVRQEKNRGVFVRDVPHDEVLEIYDIRAALDELVGRSLAATATAAQLKELRGIVDAMDRAARVGDADEYHLLNLKFHDRLVELTGNRKLLGLYRKLVNELALWRWRNLMQADALPNSAAEHKQILKSIAAGDAETAGKAMRRHVLESRDRMRSIDAAAAAPQPKGRKRA